MITALKALSIELEQTEIELRLGGDEALFELGVEERGGQVGNGSEEASEGVRGCWGLARKLGRGGTTHDAEVRRRDMTSKNVNSHGSNGTVSRSAMWMVRRVKGSKERPVYSAATGSANC